MELQRKALRLFYCGRNVHAILRDQGGGTVFRVGGQLLAESRNSAVDSIALLSVDNSGSVVGVAHESGRETFDYTAYGHCSSLSSGRSSLGFNGEYYDDLLQGYMLGNGYRLFNGMRFNSPDSFAPFRVMNAYGYCNGDPVNYVDPSGHAPWGLFSRRSYFKMKNVFKDVSRSTKSMNSFPLIDFDESVHPNRIARTIENHMKGVKELGAKLESIGAKEGSTAFRVLDRKYKLGLRAANFSEAAETFTSNMKMLQGRHLRAHEDYITRGNHNAPIYGEIAGREKHIAVLKGRRMNGSKFDYDLSDADLHSLERRREIHNRPYDLQIAELQNEVYILRGKLL